MISKVVILIAFITVSLFISELNGAPLKETKKREIIVDRRGFYLGGGANNNIIQGSQFSDLGGPVANPWINAYTHVLQRPSAVVPVGGVGAIGGGMPFSPVQQLPPQPVQQFQQAPQPFQQQAPQQYYQQFQQPQVQPQPQPQPQPQQPFQQPQQQQYYYQSQQQPQIFSQPQVQPQQQPQQYYQQVQQSQLEQLAPQVDQSQYQQVSAPQPQVAQPSYSFGVPQSQEPPKSSQQLQPITAVFSPGEPVQFKIGLPGDFQNGNYVKMANA